MMPVEPWRAHGVPPRPDANLRPVRVDRRNRDRPLHVFSRCAFSGPT